MKRHEQRDVGEPLHDMVGGRQPAAKDSPREPQEESLKHHGDELQDLVDKATGRPH